MRVKDVVVAAATLVEFGCVVGLAAIGLKCNNDCFKAECKLINEEYDHALTKIECMAKDVKIETLEKELEKFKKGDINKGEV